MKKLLPLVIASLTAGSYAVAGGHASSNAPTVYGKINVSLNNNDYESLDGDGDAVTSIDNWTVDSNASRVGIKGGYALTAKTKAIYKAEYEMFVDDGTGDGREFKARNVVVGFQGDMGTILVGKHDTPLKMAQGNVDRFNDLRLGDIKNVLAGEERADNTVMYKTPESNGFSATLAFIPGEENGDDAENDGLADGTSIAFNYKAGDLRLALAVNSDVIEDSEDALTVAEDLIGSAWVDSSDITRFVAEYQATPDLNIGLLIQNYEVDVEDGFVDTVAYEEDAVILSAAYKISNTTTVKFQYGTVEGDLSSDDIDDIEAEGTQLALGIDYNFNKNAKVFAYYSTIETESDIDDTASLDDTEDTTFAIGYQLKF